MINRETVDAIIEEKFNEVKKYKTKIELSLVGALPDQSDSIPSENTYINSLSDEALKNLLKDTLNLLERIETARVINYMSGDIVTEIIESMPENEAFYFSDVFDMLSVELATGDDAIADKITLRTLAGYFYICEDVYSPSVYLSSNARCIRLTDNEIEIEDNWVYLPTLDIWLEEDGLTQYAAKALTREYSMSEEIGG